MNAWQSAVLLLALLAMCIAALRLNLGYPAWPRRDKINYALMVGSAWSWLIYSQFATPPAAYTATAAIVFTGSLLWFLYESIRFLHASRREFARLNAQAAELAEHTDRHGHDHDWPCADSLLHIPHVRHEWLADSGRKRDCHGYPPIPL